MFDPQYLRKKCADFSTTDLLRYIFLQTDEFIPEAVEILKEELERRQGDIRQLIEKEVLRTGGVESVLHLPNRSWTL